MYEGVFLSRVRPSFSPVCADRFGGAAGSHQIFCQNRGHAHGVLEQAERRVWKPDSDSKNCASVVPEIQQWGHFNQGQTMPWMPEIGPDTCQHPEGAGQTSAGQALISPRPFGQCRHQTKLSLHHPEGGLPSLQVSPEIHA